MIAYQGITAKCFRGIPFLRDNGLRDYDNDKEPVVAFGGPKYKEIRSLLYNHKGVIIINWMGADAYKAHKHIDLITAPQIINVTTMYKARDILISKGVDCHLIRFSKDKRPQALVKGSKIYTYIHHLNESKYNAEKVREIDVPYEIMITRLDIPKKQWYAGKCDELYSKCFIGLALSSYTGSAGSSYEMGLRGIKVVTNTIDLPHCIAWQTVADIEKAIANEAQGIGTANEELADKVAGEMVIGAKGFDLKKLKR